MAFVYKNLANPYMPQGTPDLTNAPSPFYAPGELGGKFTDENTGGRYLRVKLDSGASAATAVGIVAVGQLAFWKDQAQSLVTNDKNQCDVGPSGAINRVAGVFQLAVTAAPGVNGTDGLPLQYMCDLVIKKRAYPVAATGTILAGTQFIADTSANVARGISQAAVNTAPVSQVLGVCANSVLAAGNTTLVDVSIGFEE
jgi:hypothetical protein